MATKKTTTKKTTAATPTKEEIALVSKPVEAKASKGDGKHSTKEESTSFIVYDFAGRQKAAYRADRFSPPSPEDSASKKRETAHHILVVDRSGSMYGSMEELKTNLVKLLILDEYQNAEQLVTLISYSGQGDVTTHFKRVELSKLNKHKEHQAEIKRIQPTFLTCISQGLRTAMELTNPEELTAISLHTDGYANDPSPLSETRELEKTCAELKAKSPRVFVNTIAYGYADFQLLSKIANLVSGACVKAARVTDIYSTLSATAIKLAAGAGPVHEEPLGDYDYQVFVSKSAKRINGSAGPLKMSGLGDEDDKAFYKFKKISPSEVPAGNKPPREIQYAFARALISSGQLNLAKLVLHSSGNTTLARHTRALSAEQVTNFALALDEAVFTPTSYDYTDSYNLVFKISVLELSAVLDKFKKGLEVDLDHLRKIYQRRGVKRLQGSRDENGNLVEPWLKTEPANPKETFVPVISFDLNRNAATLNMNVAQAVKLVRKDNGQAIEEVAGVKLDKLSNFYNYTLVGDGMLNVSELKIKLSEELFNELKPLQVLLDEDTSKPAETYSAGKAYILALDDLPVISYNGRFEPLDGMFEKLASLKTVSSILAAHLKEESDRFTAEQIEELKKHYLSKSLFINFPTTNPYTDRDEAIRKGEIDTRTSYKVDIGTSEITSVGKLYSANKLLERFYEAADAAKKDDISYMAQLEGKIPVKEKKLSARTKIGAVDNFQKPFLDAWLARDLSEKNVLGKTLKEAGVEGLFAAAADKKTSKETWVKELTAAMKKVDAYSDKLFRDKVAPVVFFIGSTGLLPDEFEANAMTADQLEGKYPELKLSKDEKEGLFFEVGKVLLTVYPKSEDFSR